MSEENTQENTPAPEVDPQVIREAEGQGWVPKERYRGDEKDWVDAETFVKRGREILPILRKNNENLIKELSHTKEQLKEFKLAADEFKKFQKDSYERKAKELEQQIANLKVARAQAITDGDGQKVNALDDYIDKVKDERDEAKAAAKVEAKTDISPPSGIEPSLQSWLDRNEWFGKDKRLTAQTNAIGEVLRDEFPNLSGDKFLEKLDEEIAHLLDKKKTPRGSPVESGSGRPRGGTNTDAKSYDNLPADAKKACDRFIKNGTIKSREEYCEMYDWS